MRELLNDARAAAAALMTDTCTLTRPTGQGGVYDPGSDTWTPDTATAVWSGPCRIRPAAAASAEAGTQAATVAAFTVSLPVDAAPPQPGDLITVTTAPGDPALPGTVLRVTAVPVGSHLSARRVTCEAVTV